MKEGCSVVSVAVERNILKQVDIAVVVIVVAVAAVAVAAGSDFMVVCGVLCLLHHALNSSNRLVWLLVMDRYGLSKNVF